MSAEDDPVRRGTSPGPGRPARVAANTVIFSVATGLSRIAGLVREVASAAIYGGGGPISAFTLAFAIPNLVRSLVADSALTAAFVPVFTELMEEDRRSEAIGLAGALFGLLLAVLSSLTVVFILLAPLIVPVFTGSGFTDELDALTVGLSQLMFPIVVLLALTGLVTGILNAYDHFTIPAIAPLVWNVVIIGCMVGMRPFFSGSNEVYGYAVGILAGTAVQFLMCLPVLRRVGFPLRIALHWDSRIGRVLKLMLPVTIGLGIINVDVFLNQILGTLVSERTPRAIDAAFRIYMLPQGMFSVAVATVLFPALARLAAQRDMPRLRKTSALGVRQIFLLLIPAAAATIALSEPIVRLVYQRGPITPRDTELWAEALFYFSFSLPFAGANLMLTRTLFALQMPWLPTRLAGLSLAINAAVSFALYKPLGIAGIVLGTAVGSAAMTVGQIVVLRERLGGYEVGSILFSIGAMTIGAVFLGTVSWLVFSGADNLLGRSFPAQIVTVGTALTAGAAVYAVVMLFIGLPEARQVMDLLVRRIPGRVRAARS